MRALSLGTLMLLAASGSGDKIPVPQSGALVCKTEIIARQHADRREQIVWLHCEGGLTLELQAINLGSPVTLRVIPGGTANELWLQTYTASPLNFRVVALDLQ